MAQRQESNPDLGRNTTPYDIYIGEVLVFFSKLMFLKQIWGYALLRRMACLTELEPSASGLEG